MNRPYGVDTLYNGQPVALTYSAYKPVGDGNCRRPLMVLVHGGAWVAGSNMDPDIVYFAREFARRGWYAVTANYRLGDHKTDNYSMYAFCNASLAEPCAYIYDSSEVIRANFRGQQDIKGLLRFLSLRQALDSTDRDNCFLLGESAGGFIALATVFLDRPSEKPADCFALTPAAAPDPDFSTYGCTASGTALQRPDLGSIDGDLNLPAPAYTIRGVANFFGGVLDTGMFLQSGSSPRVYLFHQGSDIIVHYDQGRLLGRASYECFAPNNICQPFYHYPNAYGSESIRRQFASMGSAAPTYRAEIVNNFQYLNDCFDNGHSVDNLPQRLNEAVDFFVQAIDTAQNNPSRNCITGINEPTANDFFFELYPQPTAGSIVLRLNSYAAPRNFEIFDVRGRNCISVTANSKETQVDITSLSAGSYFIRDREKRLARRFVVIQ